VAQGLKKTALFAAQRRAGAKMVEFAGWEMLVQYSGVIDEHVAVRARAGLFDVSHMGEIEVSGAGALEFCQRISANDVARIQVHQAQYNLLLYENGYILSIGARKLSRLRQRGQQRKGFQLDAATSGFRRRDRRRQRALCSVGASGTARRKDFAAADGARPG
jgi:hypothetical protein